MSLELVAVTRRFGKTLALDRVDLHVRRGDCYGFIGHNGAGKTTAMRIALGLQRADGGRVLVDGFDAARWPREARARLGGLIEIPGFHGHWSGRRNLTVLAELQGFARDAARREASLQFERVGLAEAGDLPVDAYSHGMRQRLGIAQALLGGPACLLLDEPMNGLDPGGIAEVRALLLRLAREEHTSVLISSHQLHELAGLCNRIGVLRRGQLLVEAETRVLLRGAERRYRLETPERDLALRRLEALSLPARAETDGAIAIELGEREPGDVARALVEHGVGLAAFAPAPASLEEIYLRYTDAGAEEARAREPIAARAEGTRSPIAVRAEGTRSPIAVRAEGARSPTARALPHGDPSAGRSAQPRAAEPGERRAPRAPLRRMFAYEATRIGTRATAWCLLAAPALLAAIAVLRRQSQARSDARAVGGAEVFSATDVTAFEGAGRALQAGLPLLAFLALGFASQSIAGELAHGTLRNVLLRPLTRAQVALGKACACVAFVVCGYSALAIVALGAAAFAFDFGDVAEILPNGARFTLTSATELWPQLALALAHPLLPLVAFTGVGFMAGAVARSGAGALALALGLGVALDLARTLLRGVDLEGAVPAAYLPSLLGDRSFLQYFVDLAQGVSNAAFAFAATAVTVPLAWIFLTFSLATVVLARRAVP